MSMKTTTHPDGFAVFRVEGREFRSLDAAQKAATNPEEVVASINGPHRDSAWARDRAGVTKESLKLDAARRHYAS